MSRFHDALSRIAGTKPQEKVFHAGTTKSDKSDTDDFWFGGSAHNNIPDHVPLYKLVQYANRDIPLGLAARMNTDLVVGGGYHLTGSNLEEKDGQDVLEIIKKFCEHNNFDALLQRACYDMWISGNFFMAWKKKDVHALRPVDQSNVIDIETDEDGDPVYYYLYNRTTPNRLYQQTNMQGGDGRLRKVPASDIIHWKFQAHESPFGTGLGQINARRGVGYRGADGQTYRKKSAFESREMADDVMDEMLYGGVPRFLINIQGDEEVVDATYDSMKNLKPNEHVVSSAADMKVESISNSPSNKFDAILARQDAAAVNGTMSPYAKILSSTDSFSYSSAKTAQQSAYPLIDAMRRILKHAVESLFRDIITKYLPSVGYSKNKVEINFYSEKGVDLDRIKQVAEILTKTPAFDGSWDPESLIEAIRNTGIPIDSTGSPGAAAMKDRRERQAAVTEEKDRIINDLMQRRRQAAGGGA